MRAGRAARILAALSLALAGLLCLGACARGPAVDPEADAPVILVRFDEQLNPGGLSLLRRAIQAAKDRDATIVLQLHTPGGEVELMWTIAKAIDRATASGVQIVAWIDDRALSAGALVAMACDYVYMAPSSVIGAAQPIYMTPGGPSAVDEKFLSAFRSEWRAWAESHNRNGALAAGMVDKNLVVLEIEEDGLSRIVDGTEWADLREREAPVRKIRTIADEQTLVSLTEQEALEYDMADGTAESLEELIELKLGLFDASVQNLESTGAERLAALLTRIAPLLLMAAIVLLFLEFQAPGFGLFGLLSVACFAALLGGRYLTGLAGIEHFVVIGLGLILLAVELLIVPGTLFAGITGGLMVVGGLIWSQLGSGLPLTNALDRSLAFDAVFTTIVWTSVGAGLALLLSRLLPHTPVLRRVISAPAGGGAIEEFGAAVGAATGPAGADASARPEPGHTGRALTDLRPVGKVALDALPGQEFEASFDGGALERGTRVRVLALRTGRLVVEPEPGAEHDDAPDNAPEA